jgi:hypothetical protein
MSQREQEFRRDKRVTFTMHARLSTSAGGEASIEDASILDLSESGLRVRVNGSLTAGQVVDVFLNKRPEPCRVIWTRPAGAKGEIIAGLEFTAPAAEARNNQPPPESRVEPEG